MVFLLTLVRFCPVVSTLHTDVLGPVALVHVHVLGHSWSWRRRDLDRTGRLLALAVERRGLDEPEHGHLLVFVTMQLVEWHTVHLLRVGGG